MLHNSKIIISDTSCLILLYKIDELNLLKSLSKKILITNTIKQEFGQPLPDWIITTAPSNSRYQQILEIDLDPGEASAIALALEVDNSILIIDDLKGRKAAEHLQLKYSGTFGLILKATQEGVLLAIRPIVDKIRKTNFRFSDTLLKTILPEAGE